MSHPVDLLCFPLLGFELNEESAPHLMELPQLDQSPEQNFIGLNQFITSLQETGFLQIGYNQFFERSAFLSALDIPDH